MDAATLTRGAARRRIFLLAAGLWFAVAGAWAPALAAQPAQDPATVERIKDLEAELRCLVCQGQSIAESDSDFAKDIRREIDRMIAEDSSDAEIKSFLVERYGDFILFRPPWQSTTVALWMGPAVLMVLALGVLYAVLRRRRGATADRQPFSEDERRRAEAMLADADQSKGKSTE